MKQYSSSLKTCLLIGVWLFATQAQAQTDTQLLARSKDPQRVQAGEALYKSMCFGCHGLNLDGGTGPNLKDAEWKHGSAPSTILNSIKKGFPDKGMMAFAGVYDDDSIANMVSFILSKQQGLRNLEYNLYQGITKNTQEYPDTTQLTVVKEAQINNGEMDFFIPETADTGIVFSAELIVPADENYHLFFEKTFASDLFSFELNGQKIALDHSRIGNAEFQIPAGKHKVSFGYFSRGKLRVPRIYLKSDNSISPLNIASRSFLFQASYDIKAKNKAVVVRKKIENLPPRTVAVGLPEKINYGFNTETCSIVGIWSGDVLNIGPNIAERGKKAAKPLGDWWFHQQPGIQLLLDGKADGWQFDRYIRKDNATFVFYQDNIKVRLSATAQGAEQIKFRFKVEGLKEKRFAIKTPDSVGAYSNEGGFRDGLLIPSLNDIDDFSIVIRKLQQEAK